MIGYKFSKKQKKVIFLDILLKVFFRDIVNNNNINRVNSWCQEYFVKIISAFIASFYLLKSNCDAAAICLKQFAFYWMCLYIFKELGMRVVLNLPCQRLYILWWETILLYCCCDEQGGGRMIDLTGLVVEYINYKGEGVGGHHSVILHWARCYLVSNSGGFVTRKRQYSVYLLWIIRSHIPVLC